MFKIHIVTWWGDPEYYLDREMAMARLEQFCSIIEPENKALMDSGREPIMPQIYEGDIFEKGDVIPPIVLDDMED